jgi:FkbM family methyltransferase
MQSYGRNKFKTTLDIMRRIDNWPTAIGMRLRQKKPGLQLLRFRDDLNVICRGRSRDWDVIHELLFANSYARALEAIREAKGPVTVLDLGGNIGLFSLLAARQRPDVTVHAFEPGPPNYRMFEMNLLANPSLGERINLHREAVGGANSTAAWFFDEQNPGGSSLYGTSGESFTVKIRSFEDVMSSLPGPIDLAKIDIEGAEFELLEETPANVWSRISNVALELHDDPRQRITREQFFERTESLGFISEEESVITHFLRRK